MPLEGVDLEVVWLKLIGYCIAQKSVRCFVTTEIGLGYPFMGQTEL